ncbi:hypothetical protein BD413DRAFT_516672 [Trametes elegans]|nr:hypothetical protein BD413DRAFT_516672 [Trametes elegans]
MLRASQDDGGPPSVTELRHARSPTRATTRGRPEHGYMRYSKRFGWTTTSDGPPNIAPQQTGAGTPSATGRPRLEWCFCDLQRCRSQGNDFGVRVRRLILWERACTAAGIPLGCSPRTLQDTERMACSFHGLPLSRNLRRYRSCSVWACSARRLVRIGWPSCYSLQ